MSKKKVIWIGSIAIFILVIAIAITIFAIVRLNKINTEDEELSNLRYKEHIKKQNEEVEKEKRINNIKAKQEYVELKKMFNGIIGNTNVDLNINESEEILNDEKNKDVIEVNLELNTIKNKIPEISCKAEFNEKEENSPTVVIKINTYSLANTDVMSDVKLLMNTLYLYYTGIDESIDFLSVLKLNKENMFYEKDRFEVMLWSPPGGNSYYFIKYKEI